MLLRAALFIPKLHGVLIFAVFACARGSDASADHGALLGRRALAGPLNGTESIARFATEAALLHPGSALFVPGLLPSDGRCFVIRLPRAERVRVLASAVGLVGLPILRGGWLPVPPAPSAPHEGGEAAFKTLALNLQRSSPQFHLCLGAASAQGCDALVTAVVEDASQAAPPTVRLRPNYPSIWSLGDGRGSALPRSLRFLAEADDLEDLRVLAVPVSGRLDIAVRVRQRVDQEAAGSLAVQEECGGAVIASAKERSLPEVIDIPRARTTSASTGRRTVCVEVAASGNDGAVASVTVASRVPGPFIAAAVATGGRFPSAAPRLAPPRRGTRAPSQQCELLRLLTSAGMDTTITATSEDGGRLHLGASLSSELLHASLANRWAGETPPGGAGAVLVIKGADIAEAAAELGAQGEICLSIKVCRASVGDFPGATSGESSRFWVTAVTDNDVVTLEDGLPFSASLPAQASHAEALWRAFRFFVPGGVARPRELTVTATSTGRARLVADTAWHPRAPSAFRWKSSADNTSHAVLRLTTEPSRASGDVHLIDCRLPCFLHFAATAALPFGAGEDADLRVQAQTDAAALKQLLEAQEQEETLAAGETQIFRYHPPVHGAEAILVSLSVSAGTASFQVSASANFPKDPALTTQRADDIVLLDSSAPVLRAARAAVGPNASSCALFVRVASSPLSSCSFAVIASAAGAIKPLWNGEETRGAVQAYGYDRYRFFVSEAEAQRERVQVTLDVIPLLGHPAVFVACSPNQFPRRQSSDWNASRPNASITFSTRDARFRPGWVNVAIAGAGQAAAYTVRARWGGAPGGPGEAPAARLQDGMEELGHVAFGASHHYALAPGSAVSGGRPVEIRAEALEGAVGICVEGPGVARRANITGSGLVGSACHGVLVVANASDLRSGGLAALDLPVKQLRPAGRLRVIGIAAPTSRFALRALISAAATTVVEEHKVVADTLQPTCCVGGALAADSVRQRRYLHFAKTPPESSAADAAADVELAALGTALPRSVRLLARWSRGGNAVDVFADNITALDVDPAGAGGGAGASAWPFERRPERSDSTGLRLRPTVAELLPGANGQEALRSGGFWLEVLVEADQPLNYTVRFADPWADHRGGGHDSVDKPGKGEAALQGVQFGGWLGSRLAVVGMALFFSCWCFHALVTCPRPCELPIADMPDGLMGAGVKSMEDVELQVHYDLHEERREPDQGGAPGRWCGYIPPSI